MTMMASGPINGESYSRLRVELSYTLYELSIGTTILRIRLMSLNDMFEGNVSLASNILVNYCKRQRKLKLLIRITRQLSGDTTVDDLGDISRSLGCFTNSHDISRSLSGA